MIVRNLVEGEAIRSVSLTRRRRVTAFGSWFVALALIVPAFLFLVAAPPSATAQERVSSEGLTIERSIQYTQSAGRPLLLDAFLPGSGGPFPAIVGAHGGGWAEGGRGWIADICKLFAHAGYACFSIDYSLLPDFHYPVQVDQMAEAVKFVRQNASQFEVDPSRIATFGTSAGATLALSVAEQYGLGNQGSQVACAVSWSAGLDLAKILDQAANNRCCPAANQPIQRLVPEYAGVPQGTDVHSDSAQKLLEDASPYHYLVKGLPPMFIANAKQEFIPFAQGQEFVAKLQQLGIPYEFFTPPTGHAVAYTFQAIQPSVQFLDKYLKNYVPAEHPKPAGGSGSSLWPIAIMVVAILASVAAVLFLRWRRPTPAHPQ